MIFIVGHRSIRVGRRQLLVALGLIATVLMMRLGGFGLAPALVLMVLTWVLLRFATKPLSRIVARLNFSIRQKFEVAITVIAVISLIAGLISYGGMDYMHQGLHQVQLLMGSEPTSEGYPVAISYLETPPEVRKAIDSLEDSQHGPFFSLIPFLSVLGVLVGATLGAAIAWSVVTPVRKMGEAMREIGSGDLSQTIQVENKDELGDLASMINETTGKLAKLQEATLATERARALRERMAQVTLAQEEERRRVSRELHDGLGPSLAAIGNRIRACQYVVRADPQHAERQLEEIAASLKVHVQEVRALIYDLRPLALDQLGLVGATRQALDRFSQGTGLHTDLDVPEDLRLNPVVEVTAFRVLQECLSNVEKHANARRVEVSLQQTNEGLMVRFQDDGRGFDPNSTAPSSLGGGVGLVSMRERAELLGGTLEIRSSPGNGCQIVASIPTMEVAVGTYPHTAS